MNSAELRQKFLKFFEEKGHKVIPSASLVPANDPTVLFTTAGMQQFKSYYTDLKNAPAKNVVSIQKCLRTSDIDEIGDESHLTFFEMLGNFSFGGYDKKRAIELAYEFITKEMDLKIDHVSVFEGAAGIPADEESEKIWRNLDPNLEIRKSGKKDNFWGPTGEVGPCGPTTEIYIKGVEIWNIVFNQYLGANIVRGYPETKTFKLGNYAISVPANTTGFFMDTSHEESILPFQVDTGMGLERLAMVVQNKKSVFETDLFSEPYSLLLIAGESVDAKSARIISDHLRSTCFLLADGLVPSNKEQGYVLRRLIRRLLVHARKTFIPKNNLVDFLNRTIDYYGGFYPELVSSRTKITEEFEKEANKFEVTLEKGLQLLSEKYPGMVAHKIEAGIKIEPFTVGKKISGKDAFDLYQSYGFPKELIKELAEENLYVFDEESFNQEFKKHQDLSRTASAGQFKGGLASHSDKIVRLHTATHLMNAALRKVLGTDVWQKGSNITEERTRFDFTHDKKMTNEEKAEVEKLVNDWIVRDLPVKKEMMSQDEAKKLGAIGVFGEKYSDTVSIYTVFDPKTNEIVSREFCGGPHVEHAGIIGRFKILKEEAVSAGVRRIKAIIE